MAGTFLNISRLEARASPASIKGRLWFWALIIVLFVQSSTSIYCGEDDCYALLGVGQDANASDIKRSYYKLSLKHHPDKNPDPESKKLFVKITTAYEILKDNETQAQYDYAIEHPSEVFYNTAQYYRAKYGHKSDPRAVLVGLLVVLSAFQYLNNVARYNEENDFTPFGGDLIGELKNALLKQRTNRASGSRLEKNAV